MAFALSACASTAPTPPSGALPPAPPVPAPTPSATATAGASSSPPSPLALVDPGVPCGELDCRRFGEARTAFEYAVRESPRVIAVGEAHAQKSAPKVPSATRRFGEQLLPALHQRAKGIVLEFVVPEKRCEKKEDEAMRERQEAVTKPQAETNQNEFVTLGFAAKKLGIFPLALVPTCEELGAVLANGEGDIAAMLALIADLTFRETSGFLDRGDPNRAVITYGGLLHNDLIPRPGREEWTFGPRLKERSGGRYVEIDLIVPEFIKPEEPWTSLAWYPHYSAERDAARAVLFQPTPASYVLIFPLTPAKAP